MKKRRSGKDIDEELKIITDFFKEVNPEIKKQLQNFGKMQESVERVDTLESQIKTWDYVLQQFVFFEEDVDLVGERVKMISKSLMERAKKEKLSKELQKVLKADRWVFDW